MIPINFNFLPPHSVAVAVAVILLSLLYYYLKNRKLPPGPRGLPYLGLWPELTHDRCHLQLQEYGRKYGDVFSYKYMGNLMINLGTVKAMREFHVQNSDCFEERHTRFSMFTYMMGDGIAFANGENWKVLRKHFLQSLKEYGMTSLKESGDAPIYESLTKAIDEIRTENGQPFDVVEMLVQRCGGTMRKIIFGTDGVTDEELKIMNDNYSVSLEGVTGNKMLYIGPFAKLIFLCSPSHWRPIKHHSVMSDLLYKVCQRIEANFDGEHPSNIIERFYYERKIRQSKKDQTAKCFYEKALVESLSQFVGDGIISVAYFIGAILNELVRHPEEQDKIFDEIKEVIGLQRLPTIEDRGRMTYTNAFMYEVMRTFTFFTLFPSLECTKEATIRGYTIPKGAITVYNIWEAHYDPKTFPNPEKFDPERYISKPGKHRAELPVLFGMGKRACTGEPLVMMETFLFLITLVKEFQISEMKDPKDKTLYMIDGKIKLCFQPRLET